MSTELLCVQTNGVTIALVVFVMLTALLLAFVIMLFTWKRFRDFFFKDEKASKKQRKAADKQNNAKSSARKSDDDNGVPTVPLDSAAELTQKSNKSKKSDTALDRVPTVIIGKAPTAKANDEKKPKAKSSNQKNDKSKK